MLLDLHPLLFCLPQNCAMASAEPWPMCSENGLSSSMLLSFVLNEHAALPEVHTITNGLVLELIRFKERHPQCTFKVFYAWIKDLYGKKWPDEGAPTIQAITRSVARLTACFSKHKKQHGTPEKEANIADFLRQEYVLPSIGLCKGRVQHFSPVKKQANKDGQLV